MEPTSFDLVRVMPDVSRAIRSKRYAEARELLETVLKKDSASAALSVLILTEPPVQHGIQRARRAA